MEYRQPADLYTLLPAVYRIRDAERGYPLRALLEIIAGQAAVVQDDIARLWDNLFVETADNWVIPYIGDLVGNTPLYEVTRGRRADVAKTIYYRRRKGTLPMLEELARDVTGWGARAVDFFEYLGWTQHVNHLRPAGHNWADLRQMDALDRLDGPFDTMAHTADVRPAAPVEGAWRPPHGRQNLPAVGFFFWRLTPYPLARVDARPAGDPRRYLFCPLGGSAPLFHNPPPESDAAARAGEIHVPGPIRPRAFADDPAAYYGEGASLAVYVGGTLVPAAGVMCKNLSAWQTPPAGQVAVDVARGRLRFADGDPAPAAGDVQVSYAYGFSGDIGGGPYRRADSLAGELGLRLQVGAGSTYPTLGAALADWALAGRPDCVIEIADSRTYSEPLSIEPGDGQLVIQAADGLRPTLRPQDAGAGEGVIRLTGSHPDATLTLNGLAIAGGLALEGSMGGLSILHCTVVPGRFRQEDGAAGDPGFPSLTAAPTNTGLEVKIVSSICGPLRLPEEATLAVSDSILDGGDGPALSGDDPALPGPAATLERVTALGECRVRELIEATAAVFTGRVRCRRVQAGCVRFSYVPPGSHTPRQYQCQPQLALQPLLEARSQLAAGDPAAAELDAEMARIRANLRPAFTSRQYGHPGYGQLSRNCPPEIRSGAEDGSEMGAFAGLQQPQRLANLRIRLEEYLPFGRDPAVLFVT